MLNEHRQEQPNFFFTDHVRSTRREVIVSLCLSVHTLWAGGGGGRGTWPGPARGGTPARGHLPGVPPCQVRMGGIPARGCTPQPGQDGGIPQPGGAPAWGTKPARSGWWEGFPARGHLPSVPPLPARSGWGGGTPARVLPARGTLLGQDSTWST